MPARTDSFDLGALRLTSGEGRRLELEVALDALTFGAQTYEIQPAVVAAVLDISCMTQGATRCACASTPRCGALHALSGAGPAGDRRGGSRGQPARRRRGLSSPYVRDEELDVRAWARDALALALPAQLLCREDCAGLCAVCGENLNEAGPDHAHERAPDSRWAKLSELKLD